MSYQIEDVNTNNSALQPDGVSVDNPPEEPTRLTYTSTAMGDPAQTLGGKMGEGDSTPTTGLQRLLNGQCIAGRKRKHFPLNA